jgi:translation initiation factor IF-3
LELRVIGKDGENLGVLKCEEALEKAKEQELDLIEIAPTALPPVAKIMDYGKFIYQQEKKSRESSQTSNKTETKEIQIGIGTSPHDLEMKAKKTDNFLKQGNRIKIDLLLKGRAKGLNRDFIKGRLDRFLHIIGEKYKIIDGPKSNPRGLNVTIAAGGEPRQGREKEK